MIEFLAKVFSLDIISTFNPVVLLVTLALIGSKIKPRERTVALLCGLLLAGVIFISLGFALGQADFAQTISKYTVSIFDIALGALFVIFGIRVIIKGEGREKIGQKGSNHPFRKWFRVGFIATLIGFDSLLLIFAASREVGVADICEVYKIILLAVNLFFLAMPILLPLFIHVAFTKSSKQILSKLSKVMIKYSKYIIFATFVVIGIILIIDGFEHFL